MEVACALAVCSFNDGISSLLSLASRLHMHPTPFYTNFLRQKDKKRAKNSVHKTSEDAKKKRRALRQKQKGLDDKHRKE